MDAQNGLPPEVGSDISMQCRRGVGLSSEREDDQDDVSSPHRVSGLGNVGRCVLESPE